jgi:hypothetical protein
MSLHDDWQRAERIWTEDDATPGTEGHGSLHQAMLAHVPGCERSHAIESEDWGDATCFRYPGGFLVMESYPGNSEIRRIK